MAAKPPRAPAPFARSVSPSRGSRWPRGAAAAPLFSWPRRWKSRTWPSCRGSIAAEKTTATDRYGRLLVNFPLSFRRFAKSPVSACAKSSPVATARIGFQSGGIVAFVLLGTLLTFGKSRVPTAGGGGGGFPSWKSHIKFATEMVPVETLPFSKPYEISPSFLSLTPPPFRENE